MSYNTPTQSIVSIFGDINLSYSGSISKIYTIKNQKITGSVFYEHQENILTKTIGNYYQTYEYFLAVGKRENNLLFKDSLPEIPYPIIPNIYGTSSTTAYSSTSSIKNVWMQKFSAPGQKESLGVGVRDKESDEYSQYNSLNFRNHIVRYGLNSEIKKVSNLYSSSYTIHGINKNSHYIANATGNIIIKYDNGNIQNILPYHMDQIKWLYSSLFRSSSYWPSWFVSSSYQTGSEYPYTESMTGSYLSDSFSSDLKCIYGFNSWTQIRSNQNWKSRLLKNNCYYYINTDINSDNIFTIESSK